MGAKSDRWIIEMAERQAMIQPFSAQQVRNGISFGTSAYGYDISLADEFKVFDPSRVAEIDPRAIIQRISLTLRPILFSFPPIPTSWLRAESTSEFRDVITVCFGKSTYARSGVIVNVTPFEPEWEGFATLSLANTAPRPVRVYAQEGIAQIIFLEAADVCQTSYKDKKGKYQGQNAITLSKSDEDGR